MKKNLVRLVALALLAVMLFSAMPAFAAITGVIENTTPMRKKADSSSAVVANVKGGVTINYQNQAMTYYNVTLTSGGQSVTGWVPRTAVTGIGRDGSSTGSSSSGSSSSGSSSSGTFTGTLAAATGLYDANNKLVATVRGGVTVNYRDAAGTRLLVTASGGGQTVSGWVSASALSNLKKNGVSATVSSLPASSAVSGGSGAAYTAYSSPYSAESTDSVIYMRKTASKSTSSSNVVSKVTSARGKVFTILGQDSSGDWLYASYNGNYGFVRERDFERVSGSTGSSAGSSTGSSSLGSASYTPYSSPRTGTSKASTIYLRRTASADNSEENVATQLTGASGATFSILGQDSTGNWLYARYSANNGNTYEGFVNKNDFTVTTGGATTGTGAGANATGSSTSSSGATAGEGSGSTSERWGTITIPNAGQYYIYGNYTYTKGGKTYYYYDENAKGDLYDVHTTTAKGSQVAVVMGHNVRKQAKNGSKGMFHNLHHIQNALANRGKCDYCGATCSTSTYGTTINASYDGYSRWEVMCFYEIGHGKGTSLLQSNMQPWKTTTQNYVNTQLTYARTSGYKGWVNPNVSYSANGRYMMLITCGDEYESSSNASSKLYMLLKAAG